jgi:hypothetical protein
VIRVQLKPIPDSRSRERPSIWEATAEVDKIAFAAVSRTNAATDLFGQLVAADVPDGEAVLFDQHGRKALHWCSFGTARPTCRLPCFDAV